MKQFIFFPGDDDALFLDNGLLNKINGAFWKIDAGESPGGYFYDYLVHVRRIIGIRYYLFSDERDTDAVKKFWLPYSNDSRILFKKYYIDIYLRAQDRLQLSEKDIDLEVLQDFGGVEAVKNEKSESAIFIELDENQLSMHF
jgi:hypothetical protein